MRLTGVELEAAIVSPPPTPPALVQEFLHANCCMMLTGETGKGKTVLAAQLSLCLSSATPLFGSLAIARPCRVYYMQLEGSPFEQLRRLHFMQTVIPVNGSNLYWDADRTTPPLSRYDQIAKAFPVPPDVVILDPIYKMTGDLAKAESALALVRFSDRLLSGLGCSVILVHHPHREKVNVYGKPITEEDFYYGHSFLKNHVEVSYAFKPLDEEGERSQLLRKKRREENTLATLDLVYHPETYTCSMLPVILDLTKREQVMSFLRSRTGQTTSFAEVLSKVPISHQFLREIQVELVDSHQLVVQRELGKPSVWLPLIDNK